MTDENDELWTGHEGAAQIGHSDAPDLDELGNSGPPPKTVSLSTLVGGFTYAEAHSLVVGFAPLFAGLLLFTLSPLLGGPLVVISWVFTIMATTGWTTYRGLRYIIREPHYCLGGQLLATLSGLLVLGLVEVVGALLGVVA